MIRKACVSGLFYDSDKDLLEDSVRSCLVRPDNRKDSGDIVAAIVPHAGYVYSGRTAGYAFHEILESDLPDTFIVLGPNHTGYGTRIDVCDYTKWETPLGAVDVDLEFIRELVNEDSNVYVDNNAHVKEHSIEVELPFLQHVCGSHPFKIVPIVISQQIPEICSTLAHSLDRVIEKLNRRCVIIASTDLNHYDNQDTTLYLDDKIIKSVESMDMKQMINDIVEYDITMCGYGPVITAVTYAKLHNYEESVVLNHSTSGEAFGDYDSVVGYMSAIIQKQ